MVGAYNPKGQAEVARIWRTPKKGARRIRKKDRVTFSVPEFERIVLLQHCGRCRRSGGTYVVS
jgi:hypothetical protein